MPLALNTRLDHNWIKPSARIDAPAPDHATRASRERRFWIKRDAPGAMLAENPTLPCAFTLTRPETDQYMDPWRDVGLSLDPMNRNRSQYAGGNPISNVDLDGHKICAFGFCTTLDEKIAAVVDTVSNAVTGDTSPTPVRSILPTGSFGPVTVSSPSVVNVSSQLTPYPGVSEADRRASIAAANCQAEGGRMDGKYRCANTSAVRTAAGFVFSSAAGWGGPSLREYPRGAHGSTRMRLAGRALPIIGAGFDYSEGYDQAWAAGQTRGESSHVGVNAAIGGYIGDIACSPATFIGSATCSTFMADHVANSTIDLQQELERNGGYLDNGYPGAEQFAANGGWNP